MTKGVLTIFAVLVVFAVLGYNIGKSSSNIGFNVKEEPTQTATTPTNDPTAKGAALYSANCIACHGDKAAGGVGPKLAGLVNTWDDAKFKDALQNGKGGDGRTLKAMMPKFPQLSDGDLKDLHAYLSSL